MSLQGGADRLAAGGIPEPQGVVVRAGDDAASIGAEGDGDDRVCVSLQPPQLQPQALQACLQRRLRRGHLLFPAQAHQGGAAQASGGDGPLQGLAGRLTTEGTRRGSHQLVHIPLLKTLQQSEPQAGCAQQRQRGHGQGLRLAEQALQATPAPAAGLLTLE